MFDRSLALVRHLINTCSVKNINGSFSNYFEQIKLLLERSF